MIELSFLLYLTGLILTWEFPRSFKSKHMRKIESLGILLQVLAVLIFMDVRGAFDVIL